MVENMSVGFVANMTVIGTLPAVAAEVEVLVENWLDEKQVSKGHHQDHLDVEASL